MEVKNFFMGMETNKVVAILLAGFAIVGIAVYVGAGELGDQLSALDSPDMINTDDVTVDAVVEVPDEISDDATVYMYEEQPDQDESGYGDTVEFYPGDVEVDEEGEETVDDGEAVFDNPNSGSYYIAVVDDPENEDVHSTFAEVTMPEEVEQAVYENEGEVTVYSDDDANYDLLQQVDVDDTLTREDDSIEALEADVTDTDGEATIERTIEFDDGVAYLGEFELDSIEDDSDAVEEFDVTVTADGSTVLSEDYEDEFGDSTSVSETLGESDDPVMAESSVEFEIEVEFDSEHDFTGEMAEFGVEDIYGDALGDGMLDITA